MRFSGCVVYSYPKVLFIHMNKMVLSDNIDSFPEAV